MSAAWCGVGGPIEKDTGGKETRPIQHTVVSVGIGTVVWAATGSALSIPAAVAAGVLIDADHAIDFYLWYMKRDQRLLLIPFHAWEYSAAGLVAILTLWQEPWFLAAVLAHLAHMAADQLANPTRPMAYFLSYRASVGFRRERLLTGTPGPFADVLRKNIPLSRWLESWLASFASLFRRDVD